MQAAIFIRLALIEARRGGLAWLAPLCIALGVALGVFLAQLAITESRLLQVAVVAALLRLSAVLIVAAQVVSSVRREADERRLEFLLALPLARATQYLGRLAGFIALGVVLAVCFALPLLLWSPPAAVLAWASSLALELALVAAAALFFAMSLTQLVPALAATAGLYLLARSISAIQAIASGPLAEQSVAHELGRGTVNALAFLLPTLDRATRTEWLLYGPPDTRTFGVALAGMLIYTALLAVAGLFDFQRRAL
jgi:ABC-type transport system involved in multi-copper enzyme maturation permease subunit